jgi:hypothetical protein
VIIARASLREAPVRHWVAITHPDGRHLLTDELDDPIVKIQRRVTARKTTKIPQDPEDLTAISAWLDEAASRITGPC